MAARRTPPAKIRKANPSRKNQGGALETKAIEEQTKFQVFVRNNGAGGYIYQNPYNGDDRKSGQTWDDDGEPEKPANFNVDLYQFDLNSHRLAIVSDALRKIDIERECILTCRSNHEDDPVRSGKKLFEVVMKDREISVRDHFKRWKRKQGLKV